MKKSPASDAKDLIMMWRRYASDAMKMSRHHDKLGWEAHHAHRDAECKEHESDRYRWRRVAETFRYCAKELKRVTK